ncbi:hypothetical protein PI124_g23666 [Phytophthora idaei]|nr:hypothetical protein PI124_g23666 [Phytophthora idaei]
MHLLYLIGLTAVIYFTSIDANASVTGSNDGPSRATSGAAVSATTVLKKNNADDNSDEERARAGVSVSAVEKLKSWFTSSNVTRNNSRVG